MCPLLAAPPNAWVELAAELAEVGERPPIDELLLQDSVGGLDDRVVVRVVLAGGGPPDIERLQQVVDVGVRELAAAIRAEHVDVRRGNPGVAKEAFTSRESFLPLAACPAISRLRRSMSGQA